MASFDVSVNTTTIKNADFNVSALKPEYVLKVNNMPEETKVQPKSVNTKKNPNPENLPAIRKTGMRKGKKVFLYFLFFLFIFSVCAFIGYKTVFYLFTI